MRTTTYECGNVDYCEPGTTHDYPAVGEVVTVREPQKVRVVGTENDWLDWMPSDPGLIDDDSTFREAHEVIAILRGRLVFVDIHELTDRHQEGEA